MTRAPTLVDGYSPKDVFNCDETGLYFRALPDKTLATKSDARKGGKMAMLEELTHYAHTEDESFLTHVNRLTHLNNTAIAKKIITSKQCTLNDFFIKH